MRNVYTKLRTLHHTLLYKHLSISLDVFRRVSQEPVKWHQKVIHVTQHSIQQAVEWIWNLQHSPVVNAESAAEALSEALDDQVVNVLMYYFF